MPDPAAGSPYAGLPRWVRAVAVVGFPVFLCMMMYWQQQRLISTFLGEFRLTLWQILAAEQDRCLDQSTDPPTIKACVDKTQPLLPK